MASREHLLDLLTPVVASTGLDLEDVEVSPAGKRRLVRVVCDKDGGVNLDDVAAVSGPVSAALDSTDALGNAPYVLEITSPGVGRPLTQRRHWRRAVGRLVEVELSDGGQLQGRLTGEDDSGVDLELAGTLRNLRWPEIRRGKVQVEFTRSGAGGSADDSDNTDDPENTDDFENDEQED